MAPACHPIQCIVPPHMLEAIRLRGDSEQRRLAERMEVEALALRDARQAAGPAAREARPGALSLEPRRETFDAEGSSSLPGRLARREGAEPVSDDTVNEAHDGAGHTYRLYRDAFGRDSLDGRGLELRSTVHFGKQFDNAFWNGQQMVYGDGDGRLFLPLTRSLSVIGHELSHGVVQFSGGLVYQDQPGALHESFADVFGVLTVQHGLREDAAAGSWLVGDGILAPGVQGRALRSLAAPGTAYDDPVLGRDPQPFHMDDFVHTGSDNGGVHINSGIPSHAFYLLARYLGGFAWEKAGRIWYDTLQQQGDPHVTFSRWADRTVEAARSRFGAGSLEATFTRRVWKLVGVPL